MIDASRSVSRQEGALRKSPHRLASLLAALSLALPALVIGFGARYGGAAGKGQQDLPPFITPDGSRLYFASNRPAQDYIGAEPRDNTDIWVVERIGDTTWSEPKSPGGAVNTPSNEWFPTLASDGTIYFGSERSGGKG